jgi:AAA domain
MLLVCGRLRRGGSEGGGVSGSRAQELETVSVVTLEEFVAVEESGAGALVGSADDALIPENGDVMIYGDGGAGKTTLSIDLACHLAAGDAWLGIPVERPARVLLVENEGPRAHFRAKLRRKAKAWTGGELGDRIRVWERPWAELSFGDRECREFLAQLISDQEIDAVVVGPVSRSGMNEAGTLQEVRNFMALLADVRCIADRPVTFVLIHHENKGGQVSGAWEGSGDTLFHVQGQGRGKTRLYIQKARWSSARHATSLQLRWTEGEGFEVEEKPELDDAAIAEKILVAVGESPGKSWSKVEDATPGVGRKRRMDVRDGLFRSGRLVNVVKRDGALVALAECPERVASHLYQADDPSISHLLPEPGADGEQTVLGWGAGGTAHLLPAPRLKGEQGVGEQFAPLDSEPGDAA